MKSKDWGVYKCKAINKIGNHEAAIVLKGKMNFEGKWWFRTASFTERFLPKVEVKKKMSSFDDRRKSYRSDSALEKRKSRKHSNRRKSNNDIVHHQEKETNEKHFDAGDEIIDDDEAYNHYSLFNSSTSPSLQHFLLMFPLFYYCWLYI